MLVYANKMQKVGIKSITWGSIYCNCFIYNVPNKQEYLVKCQETWNLSLSEISSLF